MELMILKPSLALKLNASGFSAIHLALQNNHIRMARGFVAFDSSLVSVKGRGSTTALHHVARIGDAELLSEFLFACPSSIEDLTIKCETAAHVAVKNHQFTAFKVLLGWVKRENREEILNWKDEDGNTVYHIAASTNQTEVLVLFILRLYSVLSQFLSAIDVKMSGEVVENLLDVLDNFERAKSQIKVETEGEERITNSYQSIYKQFVEILGSLGVIHVETVGKQFDPMVSSLLLAN
ncbi:PREDICTED: ankyrin repeat-containing protein At2g01680-like [Camelina sativa]|uniref:Ankyrin repeat-containing protein At2g01680-like n=1 Tax=Camelina sativa TaxID=90675 RepID=A0ABM1QQT5_CAMSA|nr:PREDICTED: ankyrin repeat-containing protein At2g01680-like [Camelina sativa]